MTDSPDEPPAFEDPFDEDVEQRVYATLLQTREPTAASAIADIADCDPKTARKYLTWFTELGIATEHDGHPTTYERNDSYFEWRRINQLASEHSLEQLQQRITTLTEQIEDYEQTYDKATPEEVDALAVADNDESTSIDEVYSDLSDWTTAHQERRFYERARQQRASNKREQVSG
jgi:predicted transcriptional regulator